MAEVQPAPALPEQVDHFQVRRHMASGGMGAVYEAWDPSLERPVAIKVLSTALSQDRELVRRFALEAKAAANLHHENVVAVYHMGEVLGRPYFAMELVDGETLAQVARRGPVSPALAVDYLVQAARGLKAAWASRVVHRDVKPSNLLLTKSGVVKVADFGLARALDIESGLTASNVILGTPHFASPEQARGEQVDCRADVYSLGATFYFLLSGTLPYEASTPMGVLLRHVNDPLPPLASRRPGLPPALCATVERMMAKRREDRFQTWDELVAHLEGLLAALRLAGPATAAAPAAAPVSAAAVGVLPSTPTVLTPRPPASARDASSPRAGSPPPGALPPGALPLRPMPEVLPGRQGFSARQWVLRSGAVVALVLFMLPIGLQLSGDSSRKARSVGAPSQAVSLQADDFAPAPDSSSGAPLPEPRGPQEESAREFDEDPAVAEREPENKSTFGSRTGSNVTPALERGVQDESLPVPASSVRRKEKTPALDPTPPAPPAPATVLAPAPVVVPASSEPPAQAPVLTSGEASRLSESPATAPVDALALEVLHPYRPSAALALQVVAAEVLGDAVQPSPAEAPSDGYRRLLGALAARGADRVPPAGAAGWEQAERTWGHLVRWAARLPVGPPEDPTPYRRVLDAFAREDLAGARSGLAALAAHLRASCARRGLAPAAFLPPGTAPLLPASPGWDALAPFAAALQPLRPADLQGLRPDGLAVGVAGRR